jgi:hypothetical protein
MMQYEYLVRSFHNGNTYQDELNDLGAMGWKLVGMAGIECVFIRPLGIPVEGYTHSEGTENS